MAEYSYDNIIVNPFKEGIESLIGKEVYFHNNPSLCLNSGKGSRNRQHQSVPFGCIGWLKANYPPLRNR